MDDGRRQDEIRGHDADGTELFREREDTPRGDYEAAPVMAELADGVTRDVSVQIDRVGVGILLGQSTR